MKIDIVIPWNRSLWSVVSLGQLQLYQIVKRPDQPCTFSSF